VTGASLADGELLVVGERGPTRTDVEESAGAESDPFAGVSSLSGD